MKFLKTIIIFLVGMSCYAGGEEQMILNRIESLAQSIEALKPAQKTYTDYLCEHWKSIAFAACIGGTYIAWKKYGPSTKKSLQNLFLSPANDHVRTKINQTKDDIAENTKIFENDLTHHEAQLQKTQQNITDLKNGVGVILTDSNNQLKTISNHVYTSYQLLNKQCNEVNNSLCSSISKQTETALKKFQAHNNNISKVHKSVRNQTEMFRAFVVKNNVEVQNTYNAIISNQSEKVNYMKSALENLQEQLTTTTDAIIPNMVSTLSDIESQLKNANQSLNKQQEQQIMAQIQTILDSFQSNNKKSGIITQNLLDANAKFNGLMNLLNIQNQSGCNQDAR